ncbi:phage neck terminator protein [Achromobacter arsenitoxydans]|uniref:Phage neck terminator protein gp12-like domain-containing protein n=1 Tax=Achromobacter arsenitoxydans SY8 TaxID=477184 RepID=H0F9N3_9BURK|nr:hypothetical protein [Achromobacter arsenitoxydans]EHK65298.1 hypothetical protein KYC_17427 [Achromobacter arsenitoxydans SY8]
MDPQDAIFELIEAAAGGVLVVFADENGPRPRPPYIALAVRWDQASSVEAGPVLDDGMQSVRQHDDASVELQAYGPSAFERLGELGLKLRHALYEERAEALGLAVFEIGRLQNIPVLRDAVRYERRGVLELGIRYARSFAAPVGRVDAVKVEFSASGGATDLPETSFTVTATPAP